MLTIALASVALALALPFKVWVAQRGQISSLESHIRSQQHRVAELKTEQARWNDPAYVRQQARQRLHYVMPGETAYIVLGHKGRHHGTSSVTSVQTATNGPWYSRLWQTVRAAGQAPATRS